MARYRLEHINHVMLGTAGLTIAAYTAYAVSVSMPKQPWHTTAVAFNSPYMWMTIPLAVVGITRFYMLVSRVEDAESPTDRMIRDVPFILNLLVWGVSVLVMLYLEI